MSHKDFNQIEETLAEVDAEIDAGATPPAEGDDEGRRSQTDIIVEYIRDRAELFHGDNDVAYARDMDSGEVRRIDGRAFRNWLADGFYRHTEKAIRDQALREARMTLEGMAMQEYRPVHVRAAGSSGRYWLDLAEPGSSLAIRIEPGRWSLEESGLMFTRADSAQPLPSPAPGGDINLLWRIANIPERSRLLVVAWLVECLRPDTPYPVIELLGEHGSAKSTAAQALRKLIDPNDADLRGAPSSATDLFVSAGTNHFVCLENISHLPAPIQDAMCVIATGGGFARRKLYTDADESVITVKRPIIINGIAASITRQDLVSRTITVELPVIRDAKERDKLDAEFEANRPAILGALLGIAAKALEHLPEMSLPRSAGPGCSSSCCWAWRWPGPWGVIRKISWLSTKRHVKTAWSGPWKHRPWLRRYATGQRPTPARPASCPPGSGSPSWRTSSPVGPIHGLDRQRDLLMPCAGRHRRSAN
ncbi:hypothetical protein HML84_04795 [Alcanivorax sp. IO_7]|nr:hypothetical protein HML84_04795 [Alcanivorax sp. IO_7]